MYSPDNHRQQFEGERGDKNKAKCSCFSEVLILPNFPNIFVDLDPNFFYATMSHMDRVVIASKNLMKHSVFAIPSVNTLFTVVENFSNNETFYC